MADSLGYNLLLRIMQERKERQRTGRQHGNITCRAEV